MPGGCCVGADCFLTPALTTHNLKVVYAFETVSLGVLSPRGKSCFIHMFFFLGFYLFDYVRLVIIGCSSQVRPLQRSLDTTTFPNQMFIEVASIAIWERNRVAMALAISVWGTNAVFYVLCKLLLPLPCVIGTKPYVNMDEYSFCTCEYSVSNILNHVLIPPLVSHCVGL
jgi:hypothetical protein